MTEDVDTLGASGTLALVAPIGAVIPDSLDGAIGLMDDPNRPWGILGTVSNGSVRHTSDPSRVFATIEDHDPERFRTVGVPSRLAILERDPRTAELRGAVWPVATLHPVNPNDVREGGPVRVVWDASIPGEVVHYDDGQRIA